jgi:hypothetical protein
MLPKVPPIGIRIWIWSSHHRRWREKPWSNHRWRWWRIIHRPHVIRRWWVILRTHGPRNMHSKSRHWG